MKILILSGTPKADGLCASLVTSAVSAARSSGCDTEVVSLCDAKLGGCKTCGDGWGDCREKHVCAFGDDGFSEIQKKVADADAYVLVTPVYWSEESEAMKSFLDRLRRCEAIRHEQSAMYGKRALLVASAGGTGNGLMSCLAELERCVGHMGGRVFDYIAVSRKTAAHKTEALRTAVAAMVSWEE